MNPNKEYKKSSFASNFKKYWMPAILYAGFIFYLSSIPAPVTPIKGIDMSPIHILEFFILSYLIFRALSRERITLWHAFVLAIIISTLYGITDEIHQLFVPGRHFSVFDILFNFIGSTLILLKMRRIKKNSTRWKGV